MPGVDRHPRTLAAAFDAAGWLAMAAGDVAEGADLARRAIELFRALEHDAGLAWSLTTLGFALAQAGDAGAESPFAECLALFRRQGHHFGMAFGLSMIGFRDARRWRAGRGGAGAVAVAR